MCGALLIAGVHLSHAVGELGRPFLQNFALRDYHAHNQNWVAVQGAQGILFFGNKNVMLEYDRVSWRKNSLSQTTYVRGLGVEQSTGRIFARCSWCATETKSSSARGSRDVCSTATSQTRTRIACCQMHWCDGRRTAIPPSL